MNKFSVIIPIHKLADPYFLIDAVNSVVNQTIVPDEIIVVIDGPIGRELDNIIENLTKKNKLVIVRLDYCMGPGAARHSGILKSQNNIIALMDSDDISRNYRFEKELDILTNENVDAVGGWIEEFTSMPGDLNKFRITPESHQKIVSYSKWRMPVNNVTMVFKKEAYLSVGGYKSLRQFEDFDLVSRMLISGMKFHNIQKVLVDVRVGNEMHKRRRGISFLTDELGVFKRMYLLGYISIWHYALNIVIRVLIRLLPTQIMKYLYMKIFRKGIKN